jgi:hypothetical protein
MIKTIKTNTPEELDNQVNAFEAATCYKTGVSRVFATQTHVTRSPGMETEYVAIIFYKEMPQ